ncbi:tRNA uracil 4-sulfurtransferase ThiI [Anaerotalea alkaliphila]|uniref:Probable tRNA sulfurtransferase n=1 Tax=Anaerotalea alkaliphila TaxID=2662126 RepID=A0A7X5HX03_9FIRM|nr:tRNA uracil 4-sulfurtransferase ThiI [Anaerotalea alkaliphila]NDL68218.1 tRNA 4-thiouridine(8) synthase ThiI [Anaerotalea alkaliphila]
MKKAFILKYGEVAIKGKNRYLFEGALVKHIRIRLNKIGQFRVVKEQGRIYVEPLEPEYDYDQVVEVLGKVFGIVGICPVSVLETFDFEEIKAGVEAFLAEQYQDFHFTFKVESRRTNKKYPLNTMEISSKVGGHLLRAFPDLTVDVHHPQVKVMVELRNNTYIYSKVIPALGGMPVGTNGKAMLLLSGGIDSPVAGFMVAKRGVLLDAVYFHSHPYTSDRAKEKVVKLATLLAAYTGPINLHVVPFTEIQMHIYEKTPHEQLTILMRRAMMRLAESVAVEAEAQALVTGESIGQVASQTLQSLAATDAATSMPVFRPLIGFDKQEIMDLSEKIGTYETSILPYEDCCTVFVAKHPVTKPSLLALGKYEAMLGNMEAMYAKALEDREILHIQG